MGVGVALPAWRCCITCIVLLGARWSCLAPCLIRRDSCRCPLLIFAPSAVLRLPLQAACMHRRMRRGWAAACTRLLWRRCARWPQTPHPRQAFCCWLAAGWLAGREGPAAANVASILSLCPLSVKTFAAGAMLFGSSHSSHSLPVCLVCCSRRLRQPAWQRCGRPM